MRLTVLGGGGFRVPLIYRALALEPMTLIDEIVLYDIDTSRLEVISQVLKQLAVTVSGAPSVTITTDLDEALRGSDFVFCAIRVGGLAGRVADERAAIAEGLLGQETTGPGGVTYGLRTVPVVVRLARRIAEIAPGAWIINFTNPAGLVTEAMAAALGDRVLGICDSPEALCRRAARVLEVEPEHAWYDYVGLNHLGWLRAVLIDGRDRLPDLLGNDEKISALEEGRLFGTDWLRALGAVPNEYLWYWYFQREAKTVGGTGPTRGEFLLDQQTRFYTAVRKDPASALMEWQRALTERDASYLAAERDLAGAGSRDEADGGYERVALAVVRAIARNERSVHILNVRNRAALPGLDATAVVEVPCVVDSNGAHPVAVGPVNEHMMGLIQGVKAVERATIDASLHGSRGLAVRALAMHPMVDSVVAARRLLDATALPF